MIERKTFPADGTHTISIAAEQMSDGRWAVVASVKQATGSAERVIDLPVPDQRFATEKEAEEFGLRMGKEWIDRNAPKVA
jgi:hypothetical protein